MTDYVGSTTHHFVCYDGNGNVAALIDAGNAAATARYEYGPFGEALRNTATEARTNPFRFSTKFTDSESGLVYYGYRYYNAGLGRWTGRDPVAEAGGENVYAFGANDSVTHVDKLGRDFKWNTPKYDPNHKSITNGEWVTVGEVGWERFDPKVYVLPRNGNGCCYGLGFSGNYARVWAWWVHGDVGASLHEINHIISHYYPAYLGYKAESETYFSPCKTSGQAYCLKAAIEGELADAWVAWSHAVAAAWDCQMYGGPACQREQDNAQDYQKKNRIAHDELSRCSTLD